MVFKITLVLVMFALVKIDSYGIKIKNRQVVVFPKAANDKILAVIYKCAKNETNIPNILKIVREGSYLETVEFQNFVHCAYKLSGYAYDNGRIKTEHAASVYPDPVKELAVMKKCDKERGSTPVETTFNFFKCFQRNTPYLIGFDSSSYVPSKV